MLKPGDKLQKLLTLLVTWAVLVLLFFVYEEYFVKGQREYLHERGFRVLAVLSNELTAKVRQAQSTTKSFSKLLEGPRQSVRGDQPATNATPNSPANLLNKYLEIYLNVAQVPDKSFTVPPNCNRTADDVPLELTRDPSSLVLSVRCLVKNEKDPGVPALSDKSLYTVDLGPWIQGSFKELGGFFDDVLVADSAGKVLFQESRNGPRIADLHGLLPKDKPKKANQKGQPEETPPPPKDSEVSDGSGFQILRQASASAGVTLAGESYELFALPPSRVLSNPRFGADSWDLMVCGLRRTEGLESDSHSVPYSTLIWLGMIAVMFFSLSWPLFKLRLMSNTERFSPRDGWYLILAIFLAAISATLMILNVSYTTRVQAATDRDMKRLADAISDNVHLEISRAFQQLEQLPADPEVFRAFSDSSQPQSIASYLSRGRENQCYPFFKSAVWIDQNGQQQIKVDVQQVPTPMIPVGSLPYFKNSNSDRNWLHIEEDVQSHRNETVLPPLASCKSPDLKSLLSAHLHAEPRFSVNTGEFHLVLAAPFFARNRGQDKELSVQALTTEPLSLINPILPPGYGFAVVDEKCSVLFHSQSIRNLKENFCEESKDSAELLPWLRRGSDTWLDISYTGRRERAYLRPLFLPGLSTGQAFLVVFQEPEREVTLNLAIILVCAILLGAYFMIPLLAALLHLSLRGPFRWVYPPQVVWPCKENALGYVDLFAANGSMFVLFWLSYQWLHEAPLLILTLAVPFLSVLFVFLKLRAFTHGLHRFGAALSFLASAAIVTVLTWWELRALRGTFEWPPLEWLILFVSFGAVGQIATLLSGKPSWIRRRINDGFRVPGRVGESIPKRLSLAYALLALSVTACVAVVPCVGFFKYAYDATTELALKHDQLSVSRRLLERRDSIRHYYEQLNVPNSQKLTAFKTAKNRMGNLLGRYDRIEGRLTTECEPTLTFEDQPAKCKGLEEPEREDVSDRSDWVEKQIAKATLKFPSNQLGSEIGKLGVASTDDEGPSQEHYWIEEDATQFALHWNPGFIGSKLTVRSRYTEWQGLPLLGWICFVLLCFFLTLWLISIVRRIFLTDIQSALPLDLFESKRIENIQNDLLVIGPPKSGDRLRAIVDMKKVDWRDMRVELDAAIRDPKHRLTNCRGSMLVLEHFEFNLNDRTHNLARLNLLESLLYDSSRKVVIISTIDLLYFLTEGAPDVLSDKKDPEEARRLLGRWANALSKFTKLQMEDVGKADFDKKVAEFAQYNERCAQFAIWVWKECSHTEFLRDMGIQILEKLRKQPETRGWLVSTVLDGADTYYHVLWSSLAATERLVLYQLALDGWANPKNAAALQQLERKLLIYKAPMYRVMNESFRRFIKSPEHADEIANWERHDQQSTWRALRLFLTVIGIAAGIWLLYAQAELFQVGVGYVVAIGTLLTAVTGLLGRSNPAAAPAEPSAPQPST